MQVTSFTVLMLIAWMMALQGRHVRPVQAPKRISNVSSCPPTATAFSGTPLTRKHQQDISGQTLPACTLLMLAGCGDSAVGHLYGTLLTCT